MMPLEIVICDDEYETIIENKRILAECLESYGIDYTLQCFDDGALCREYLSSHRPDLIFMDIYLNAGQMGTEVARKLREFNEDARLVFLSSSNEFATESFAVNAAYYLIKPLTREKLEEALKRCGLLEPEELVSIDIGGELLQLNPKSIVAFEVQNKYTFIHTLQGAARVRCPLSKFTEYFQGPDFISPHRSYLVNLHQVKSVEDDRFIMKNGLRIPLKARTSRDMKNAYIDWMFNKI